MAKVLQFPSDASEGPTTENRKVSRGSPPKRTAKPRKHLTEEEVERLIRYVDQIYIDFGAPEKVYGTNEDEVNRIAREAVIADLKLIPSAIRHVGTEMWPGMLRKFEDTISRTPPAGALRPGGPARDLCLLELFRYAGTV